MNLMKALEETCSQHHRHGAAHEYCRPTSGRPFHFDGRTLHLIAYSESWLYDSDTIAVLHDQGSGEFFLEHETSCACCSDPFSIIYSLDKVERFTSADSLQERIEEALAKVETPEDWERFKETLAQYFTSDDS